MRNIERMRSPCPSSVHTARTRLSALPKYAHSYCQMYRCVCLLIAMQFHMLSIRISSASYDSSLDYAFATDAQYPSPHLLLFLLFLLFFLVPLPSLPCLPPCPPSLFLFHRFLHLFLLNVPRISLSLLDSAFAYPETHFTNIIKSCRP